MLILLLACASTPATAPTPTAPAPAPAAEPPAAPAAIREESVAELAAAQAHGGVALIDVRTPGEFAGGHVPGAVNIPLDEIDARLAELPEAGDVHFICAAGGRSGKATAMLTAKGRSAVNVAGGTNAWIAAGLPIEK